jgi:hypothetical protein
MSYRVFWAPHAEQQLEELLQDLSSQSLIAGAARQIDEHLAAYPFKFGESRYDTVRVAFARPSWRAV